MPSDGHIIRPVSVAETRTPVFFWRNYNTERKRCESNPSFEVFVTWYSRCLKNSSRKTRARMECQTWSRNSLKTGVNYSDELPSHWSTLIGSIKNGKFANNFSNFCQFFNLFHGRYFWDLVLFVATFSQGNSISIYRSRASDETRK